MSKNFNLKANPVTTILGIIAAIVSLLQLFGYLNPEQGSEFVEYATEIVLGIAGIIAIFWAKDKLSND